MKLHIEFTGFEQRLLLNEQSFMAKIYEGEGEAPEGFNAVRILLDASDRSLLKWEGASQAAQNAVEKGLFIFWELQFSLLEGSLEDESRFLSFQLNIHHFHETLWPRFNEQTLGIALFRGVLDLSNRDSVLDYLKSLAALFPEEACCCIFLDTTSVRNPVDYFRLLSQESFGYLLPILKGPLVELYPWAIPALAWGHASSTLGFCSNDLKTPLLQKRVSHALCLPKEGDWEKIQQAIESLTPLPFRVIPEELLTHEWDGIDKLIIFPDAHPEQVWRKMRGFTAAGGQLINYPIDAASFRLQETSQPFSPAFSPQIDR